MSKKIKRKIIKKFIVYGVFIIWFVIVYFFSNQNGAESGKVSEKVTRKILQTKDSLEIVADVYEPNNEIVIKKNENNPITKKRIDKWEVPVRKLAHFVLFFCGGIIILVMFKYGIELKNNLVLCSISLGLLIACSDEFHQLYSLNRTPQLFDVFIDLLGVVAGVLIFKVFCYFLEKKLIIIKIRMFKR